MPTHKRKCSLQDSPVDLSKLRMATQRLAELKTEPEEIEETEAEMQEVMLHVAALEDILSTAKKPKVSFSAITFSDLEKLGVKRKRLIISSKALQARVDEETHVDLVDLEARINKIYDRVNMDYVAGARMILDAILIALSDIVATGQSGVAILPKAKIGPGDGIPVVNSKTGYELWLSGSADYAVLEYVDDDDHDDKDRLLAPGSSRADVFKLANGMLLLVEAKRLGVQSFTSFIPEAVG